MECPYCRKPVDPTDPATTYAIQPVDPTDPNSAYSVEYLRTTAGATETHSVEYIVRDEGYFHPGSSPDALGWEAKPHPV